MNFLTSLRTVIVAAVVAAPVSGFAKGNGHHHQSSNYRGGHSHGYRGGYYAARPYYAPVAYRSYARPYYGYGGYYGGPAISIGFSTAPAYYGGAYYGGGYYNSYPTRTVYRGAVLRQTARYDDDLAVDVQRALAKRGFYRGGIDGDVGPGTRAAIRAYQYDRGLEVTGRIDNSLLRSLRLS